MRIQGVARVTVLRMMALLAVGIGASTAATPAISQTVSASDFVTAKQAALPVAPVVESRVVDRVDDARLMKLTGSVHPMAQARFEQGLVDSQLPMERMQLVLQRSPAQEAALQKFMGGAARPEVFQLSSLATRRGVRQALWPIRQ